MRSRTSLLVAIASISVVATGAWLPGQGLGGRISGSTPRQANHAGQGAGLFGFVWPADPGANRFNARACSNCHREPSLGGITKDPSLLVRVTPNSGDPSGFVTDPLKEEKDGKVSVRPSPTRFEFRRAIPLYGIGFLEAVPAATLLKLSDPSDKDGDGISGRLLKVGNAYGRFGWKGAVPSVQAFVHGAFEKELGVAVFKPGMTEAQMDENQVRMVTTFLQTLAPPSPIRAASDPVIVKGRLVFEDIGCGSCHVPTLKTGQSEISGLANKEIAPFSDLLLHDMGQGNPKIDQGPRASSREYRTAPLWGIGHVGGPYWHNARASTFDEAIRLHEGEGLSARKAYLALGEADRASLWDFLANL